MSNRKRSKTIHSRPGLMKVEPFEDFWNRFLCLIDADDKNKDADRKSLQLENNQEWLQKTNTQDLKKWMLEASKGPPKE